MSILLVYLGLCQEAQRSSLTLPQIQLPPFIFSSSPNFFFTNPFPPCCTSNHAPNSHFVHIPLPETRLQRKMEAAGLAVSAIGLVGLFSSVLDALEKIDAYRKFGDESRFITTQLELNKAHFRQWADRVGIADTTSAAGAVKPRTEHHPKLDDPVVCKLVHRTLECMNERLNPSEKTLKDLDMADIDDEILLPSLTGDSAGGAKMAARTQRSANPLKSLHSVTAAATTSRKTKLRWAFSGKSRVMKQLSEFKWLLEKLWKLLPPEAADDKGTHRPTATGNADMASGLTSNAHLPIPVISPSTSSLTLEFAGIAERTADLLQRNRERCDGMFGRCTLILWRRHDG